MKRRAAIALPILLLSTACGDPEPGKVEISATGDTANLKGKLCVEVTWNAPTTSYATDVCTPEDLEPGKFSVKLSGASIDPAVDFFDHSGKVVVTIGGSTEFEGKVTNRVEELEDEAAKVSLVATFEGTMPNP